MKFKKRFLLLVFPALLLESCFNPSKTENVRKENSLEEKGNQVRGSYSTTIQDSVKKMSKPKNKPNPVTKVTLGWSVDAGNYFRGKIDDKYPITSLLILRQKVFTLLMRWFTLGYLLLVDGITMIK